VRSIRTLKKLNHFAEVAGSLVDTRGLIPPNKVIIPAQWNKKHYKSVEFLSIFNVKPSCTNVKSPYWRLSRDGSACKSRKSASETGEVFIAQDYTRVPHMALLDCFIFKARPSSKTEATTNRRMCFRNETFQNCEKHTLSFGNKYLLRNVEDLVCLRHE